MRYESCRAAYEAATLKGGSAIRKAAESRTHVRIRGCADRGRHVLRMSPHDEVRFAGMQGVALEVLESGAEGSVHVDHALEYNEDPGALSELLVHRLTLKSGRAA